jgi:deoxyribodipyrimidine photo-lyase
MIIRAERIQRLNDLDVQPGAYVLYWMQQAQRAEENPALEFAVQQANALRQPLVVVFGLTDAYPEANWRHYAFLLEGLQETRAALARRGIKLLVRCGHPVQVALQAGRRTSLLVCDRGYLRHQRAWRQEAAEQAQCRVVQVETDVIVPVEVASDKAEYAARTLRPKIHRHLAAYLTDVPAIPLEHPSLELDVPGPAGVNSAQVLPTLKLDRQVEPVSHLRRGGTSQAKARFADFLEHHLPRYAVNSNQPHTDDISHLSPYLHFGQVSPVYLARQLQQHPSSLEKSGEAFLEQLLVRRELAMNFVYYTPDYDSLACLPRWAATTLDVHRHDERPYQYTPDQLERADTHDPYWNAAMQAMRHTGFLHNYMRMYWGKKILEWSASPEQAFQTILALNNTYFLDGRDPNSYAGVAWLFGVHDRAWPERPIFGKVRCMTAAGLERKCDMPAYLRKVEQFITHTERNTVD